jgi:DinB superfamily
MIRTIAWFEREFSFDLPVWMYANVIERLRGTPARLEDRIGSLPVATLTHREAGHWSIQEHAGHLLDLGPLDLVRLDDYEAGRASLTPADRENRKTYEADHNARAVADILKAFRAERAEFVRRLEQYDAELVQRTALHLRLKTKMRLLDFAFFIAEHDDHHLARINELIHTP